MESSAIKAWLLLALLPLLCWAGAAWAEPAPYEARYSIYRNGKLTGKMEIELSRDGPIWEMRSNGSGTHGLARILGARDREQVTGRVDDGRFLPRQHSRHTRVAGIDKHWETRFDWDQDRAVMVHNNDDPVELALDGRALDPLSLKIEMRRRLQSPDPDLAFLMVEEDGVDEQKFRVLEREWIETSLGCLETVPTEKIRNNNRRYTRAWHAPGLGYVEVRIEHGKTGGDHMEMRITELSFDGEQVLPRPGCSALQAAGHIPDRGTF